MQTQDSQSSVPLTTEEKKEGILYIEKFALSVEAETLLRDVIRRERELMDRERALLNRELDFEKQRTSLAERDAAVERNRADFYKNTADSLTKKNSFGCVLKKIFTVGLSKCG